MLFGTAHVRSGTSFTPDNRYFDSGFFNVHEHSDTDPSSYMYLLEMYDQWGVLFGSYSQDDIDLGLAYVMYALEQLQVVIEETKHELNSIDDCVDENQDAIGTNFWFLNKNTAAINQNDYYIAYINWRLHNL